MQARLNRVCEAAHDGDRAGEDSEALRLMLDYVAAECRRLGAAEAAHAAARAAMLLAGVRLQNALN